MQMKKTEPLSLAVALSILFAPGSWAANVQTARVAPVLRAPVAPAVRVTLPGGAGALSPIHLQASPALAPALSAPKASAVAAPAAALAAPKAEAAPVGPVAAAAPSAQGAEAAAQAKPAEQGAEFNKVFDGVKAQPAAAADAVAGAESPVASYLTRPADSALPELKAVWKPAKGPSESAVTVTQDNGPLTDAASDAADAVDYSGAWVQVEAPDSQKTADKVLQQRWVASDLRYAALVEGGMFWVEKDGMAFVHNRATGRTHKIDAKLSGPVAVSEDGLNIFAVTDGRLKVWSFKPKTDGMTLNVFKAEVVDGAAVKALEPLPAESAGDLGSGVQIVREADRLFWNGKKLVSQVQGEEKLSRPLKLVSAGKGLYLEATAEGTRLWVKPHVGSETKLEDAGTLPFAVKALVAAPERGVFYAATSDGVVEWDAKTQRYRVFPVAGLSDAKGPVALDADKQGRVLVASAYSLSVVELGDARGYMDSRAAEVRLWSQANPMYIEGGFLHIGDFKFPITKKAPVVRPWYKKAWDRLTGKKLPAAVADMGISEKEWQALNLPTNKRLVYDTLKGFSMSQHMLYIGETGGGKTWIAERIAKLTGNDLWMVSMNEYTRNKDLIARETFGEEGKGRTGLTMSTVLRWMTEGGILLLDEMHKPLEGIAVLNNILQNGEYRLPDGRVIKYDKKKSWVIGTMNPVKPPYKGEPPSGELSSRFGMTLEVKYLPKEEESALLGIFFSKVPKELLGKLVDIANDLRKVYPDVLPLPIAPRTLMHIVEHAARYPNDNIVDIFTKTYNPASIVEDPAISEAITRVLEAHDLAGTGVKKEEPKPAAKKSADEDPF